MNVPGTNAFSDHHRRSIRNAEYRNRGKLLDHAGNRICRHGGFSDSAENHRLYRGPQRPHKLIECHRQTIMKKIPQQSFVSGQQIPYTEAKPFVNPQRIHRQHAKLRYPRNQGSDRGALDSKRRRPQQAENENGVKNHIQQKGDDIRHYRYTHNFHASDGGHIGIRQPEKEIDISHYSQIIRAICNDDRIAGINPHDHLGHAQHQQTK